MSGEGGKGSGVVATNIALDLNSSTTILKDERVTEERLATTNAQLIVTLGSITSIPVQDATQFSGLYCIITYDKQQVLTDASMAKTKTGSDGKLYVGCEWSDVIRFDVTQAIEKSYISISVWGRNNEGSASLGTAQYGLSGLSNDASQNVEISVRLNKERKTISAPAPSPGSGKLSVASTKTPNRSPGAAASSRTPTTSDSRDKTSDAKSTSVSSTPTAYKTPAKGSKSELPIMSPEGDHSATFAQLTLTIRLQRQKTKVSENDFEKLRVIGRGTFGKVFQARKKDTGRIYAMKVLKKDHVVKNNAVKHTMSENHVLKNINHPFIVNLKYAFQTSSHLYMVIDYLNGGELFYHLTHDDYFVEPRAKLYAAEVVSALGYLHEHNILYRDLKPENLILDMHGHICLVDFGLCKVGWMPETKTHTFCGSAEYLSPELLRGKGYGKEVDWWALGTLIYEMLSGLPPFWDEDEEYMQKKIISAPLKMHKYFSNEAKDLIRQLLNRDPEARLGSGVNGTAQIKAHAWFADIDWAALDRREITPQFVPHLKNEQDLPYVEPEVLSEMPALSLTNASLNLDSDLFAGFSYDSEAIFASQMAAANNGNAPGSGKRGSSRRDGSAVTAGRRARADSLYSSDSDSDLPSSSSSSTHGSQKLKNRSNGGSHNTTPTHYAAPGTSIGTGGLIFDLEDDADL